MADLVPLETFLAGFQDTTVAQGCPVWVEGEKHEVRAVLDLTVVVQPMRPDGDQDRRVVGKARVQVDPDEATLAPAEERVRWGRQPRKPRPPRAPRTPPPAPELPAEPEPPVAPSPPACPSVRPTPEPPSSSSASDARPLPARVEELVSELLRAWARADELRAELRRYRLAMRLVAPHMALSPAPVLVPPLNRRAPRSVRAAVRELIRVWALEDELGRELLERRRLIRRVHRRIAVALAITGASAYNRDMNATKTESRERGAA